MRRRKNRQTDRHICGDLGIGHSTVARILRREGAQPPWQSARYRLAHSCRVARTFSVVSTSAAVLFPLFVNRTCRLVWND
jgi:transcriptional regulator with XRE-family HTH domain